MDGTSAISSMPLSYLFSKPGLRPYGMERAARILVQPALASTKHMLATAFWNWKKVNLGVVSRIA